MRCLFIGGCADGTWHNVPNPGSLGPLPVRQYEMPKYVSYDDPGILAREYVTSHTYVPWIHRIVEWERCHSRLILHHHEHEHWIYRFEGIKHSTNSSLATVAQHRVVAYPIQSR